MKLIAAVAMTLALAIPVAAQQDTQPNNPNPQPGAAAPQPGGTNDQGVRQDPRGAAGQNRDLDRNTATNRDTRSTGQADQNDVNRNSAAGQAGELPATASPLGLIGLAGLFALGGAAAVRKFGVR